MTPETRDKARRIADLAFGEADYGTVVDAIANAIFSATPKEEAAKPVAWLHTRHMEGGQTQKRLEFDDDNAFGVPGRDYSAEYEVTIDPLFAAPPQPSGEVERMREALRRLASPEAFIVSRSTNEEERARMFYAEAILAGNDAPEEYAIRRALGIGREI